MSLNFLTNLLFEVQSGQVHHVWYIQQKLFTAEQIC